MKLTKAQKEFLRLISSHTIIVQDSGKTARIVGVNNLKLPINTFNSLYKKGAFLEGTFVDDKIMIFRTFKTTNEAKTLAGVK
jgi:hypothetical protein